MIVKFKKTMCFIIPIMIISVLFFGTVSATTSYSN